MSVKQLSVEEQKARIDKMNHYQMAYTYRFAKSGHPYFSIEELHIHFMKRFSSKGGMTPEMSKRVGW